MADRADFVWMESVDVKKGYCKGVEMSVAIGFRLRGAMGGGRNRGWGDARSH